MQLFANLRLSGRSQFIRKDFHIGQSFLSGIGTMEDCTERVSDLQKGQQFHQRVRISCRYTSLETKSQQKISSALSSCTYCDVMSIKFEDCRLASKAS